MASAMCEAWTSRCSCWFLKRQRNQRSNCQHLLDHRESKGIPENIYLCFIDYVKAFDCVDYNKLWKILKEMGIPYHQTCLLRNLYAGQETTVRTGLGKTDWFHKEYVKTVYCHPAYLTYMQSTSFRNAGMDKSQAEMKIARRNISNLRYADDTWQKVKKS